jgi:hypothetical protein
VAPASHVSPVTTVSPVWLSPFAHLTTCRPYRHVGFGTVAGCTGSTDVVVSTGSDRCYIRYCSSRPAYRQKYLGDRGYISASRLRSAVHRPPVAAVGALTLNRRSQQYPSRILLV